MIYFLLSLICLAIWLPIRRYKASDDTRRERKWEMFIYGTPIMMMRPREPWTVERSVRFWSMSWKERDVR